MLAAVSTRVRQDRAERQASSHTRDSLGGVLSCVGRANHHTSVTKPHGLPVSRRGRLTLSQLGWAHPPASIALKDYNLDDMPSMIRLCALLVVVATSWSFTLSDAIMGAQAPPVAPAPAAGRGGGPGAIAAALFVDKCAGCHGTDVSGGRAASLFDPKLLERLDDDRLVRIMRAGLPATGMPAFEDLSEEQVGQLIHHIRAETGNLAPKPAFVATPAGYILKTEKQTVKAELIADGLETPWALAFLPDGRLRSEER